MSANHDVCVTASALPSQNLPVLLGLLGVWNASFLKYVWSGPCHE